MARKPFFPVPDGISLPNAGSKCQTPASLNIDLHYAQLNIWARWDWNRYTRLAKFLNVTTAELASMACFTHRQMESFKRRNHLYHQAGPDRAATLILTLLEAHCCKKYTDDVIENPFPNLAAQSE